VVNISRGNIVLCDLNPVIGTEQAGVRPVVILQTDRANKVSPHTLIAPFTTKIKQVILPSHVFIPKEVGGLTQNSILLCEQIRVVDKRRILKILGHLEDPYLKEVAKALRSILEL
jgi:mRNA interferase MazF